MKERREKMELYRTTSEENIASILDKGLVPSVSDKLSNSRERIEAAGVFGFIDKDSARHFGMDNFGNYAIVLFEADDDNLINDPEYDGEAKFYKSDHNVPVKEVVEA